MKKKNGHGLWHELSCFILFLFILLAGCEKEQEKDSTIQILSASQVGLAEYEVVLESEIHDDNLRGELVFKDLSVTSETDVVFNLDLIKNYRQTDTFRYNINRLNHNYRIQARLMKNNVPVIMAEKVVNSTVATFDVKIPADPFYGDVEHGLATIVGKDQSFKITIDCDSKVKVDTIQVKLNKTILLKNDISFWPYYSTSTGSGLAYLNDNIEAGIYDVYVYLDNIEFKVDGQIEVLDKTWSIVNTEFPGLDYNQFATFVHGDNLFVTGGYDPSYQSNRKVWSFNFILNKWKQLRDFPVGNNEISPGNLYLEDTWYVRVVNYLDNGSIEFWKYDEMQDTWQLVTSYPGGGSGITSFIVGERLFAGGGFRNDNGIKYYTDFWYFDLVTKTWHQCKDMPVISIGPVILSCTHSELVYVFPFDNNFWSYNSMDDKWTLLNSFPGPTRGKANLVALNNKIYLIGSTSEYYLPLKDCWAYDISDDTWILDSFFPTYASIGFANTYRNSLISGLGYTVWDKQDLYIMTP
jgi:N-acetylneuraminic acid mutarotase